MHNAIQQGFPQGNFRVVTLVRSHEPIEACAQLIVLLQHGIGFLHLSEQRAAEFAPVLEGRSFAGSGKDSNLKLMGTFLGEEQCQVGEDAVTGFQPQGHVLLFFQFDFLLGKYILQGSESQFLLQGAASFISLSIAGDNHGAYSIC